MDATAKEAAQANYNKLYDIRYKDASGRFYAVAEQAGSNQGYQGGRKGLKTFRGEYALEQYVTENATRLQAEGVGMGTITGGYSDYSATFNVPAATYESTVAQCIEQMRLDIGR